MQQNTLQALLQNPGWLRQLCGKLADDWNTAQDLEQDVWLGELQRQGRAIHRWRPWMGRVAKNRARQNHKAAAARAWREEHYAKQRASHAEPADEVLERAEMHALVANQVLALSDPYRTTLLLHFFEGLSLQAIAERQGMKPSTVRTHLQRGLDQLRGRLRDRYPGERAGLLPLLILSSEDGLPTAGVALTGTKSGGWLALALLAVIGVVALAYLQGSGKDGSLASGLQVLGEDDASAALGEPVAETNQARRQALGPVPEQTSSAGRIEGRLVSAAHGQGIAGTLRNASGFVVAQADGNGFFLIEADALGDALTAHAPFHASGALETAGWEAQAQPVRVELNPELNARLVVVRPSGEPLAGCRVTLSSVPHSRDTRRLHAWTRPYRWSGPARVTDAQGECALALAGEVRARVETPGNAVAFVDLGPDDVRELIVPDGAFRLRLLDAETGAGLPDVAFKLQPAEGMGFRNSDLSYRTDSLGEARLPVWDGGVRLIVPSADSMRMSEVAFENTSHLSQSGHRLELPRVAAGGSVDVWVETETIRLRLIDKSSGVPIQGPVRFGRLNEPTPGATGYSSAWRITSRASFQREANQGEVLISKSEVGIRKHSLRRISPRNHLVLVVPGYRSKAIALPDLPQDDAWLTVALDPAQKMTRARLVWPDGQPFQGRYTILDPAAKTVLSDGRTRPDGSTQAFPAGSEQVVCMYTTGVPRNVTDIRAGLAGPRQGGRVLREHIDWDLPLVIKLPMPVGKGSLRIERIPAGAPEVIAQDWAGQMLVPSHYQAGADGTMTAVFESLPPGCYVLGPEAWVKALVKQGVHGAEGRGSRLFAFIEPEDEAVSQWQPDWWQPSPIEGRIECDPAILPNLRVAPIYGSGERMGAAQRGVRVSANGKYSVPPGPGRPALLVLTSTDPDEEFPAQSKTQITTFEPGSNVRVDFGSIRFVPTSEDASSARVDIRNMTREQQRETKVRPSKVIMRQLGLFANQEARVVRWVPVDAAEVLVHYSDPKTRDTWIAAFPIAMKPGEEVVVEY